MKSIAAYIAVVIVLASGTFFGLRVTAATKPVTLSEMDKVVLMKTDAQLQLLQQKFQREAQPVMDEQMGILKRVCKQVNAVPGVDCEVNAQTGAVTKKAPTPPIPEKK